MISLTQLRTIPKIQPNMEKQEHLLSYLFVVEHAIIDAWREHKSSVTVERKDDIMDGNELKEYLRSNGFKVTLTRKPPFQVKIFFKEAQQ
jgi:hypothetical protein